MKKAVVIGADGFIGQKLSIGLKESGIDILALAYNISNPVKALFERYDIPFESFSFESISNIKVKSYDTVYHMAWAGVCSTLKNNSTEQYKNIIYGIKVIDWAKNNGIRRIIMPGSASEVSCGNGIITGYETPAPSDMYSACKVATRIVCQTYARLNQVELIWALITSVYGPGRNDNNLITYTIKSLLNGETPVFTKLEQKWDYIYIDDLIRALICLGEHGKSGKIYPVGSGENAPMKEYVEKIRNYINPNVTLGIGRLPYKNNSIIDNQVLDVSSLIEETGFIPQVSFEEGIRRTTNYIKDNKI